MHIFQAVLVLLCTAPAVLAETAVDRSAPPVPRPAETVVTGTREVPADLGFAAWVEGFRARALAQGVRAEVFDRAMRGLAFDPDVVSRDRNQAEFSRQIWDYLDRAVSPARIDNGLAALGDHGAVLAEIEARYGVEAEVVAAIWGLETGYGTFRGDVPILSAMASLAYDGRRARFFEAQLIAALKIVQAGDVAPADMLGSWAGAMGHTQFMPTSYLGLAVDFTGDGRRDIWGDDPSDALASTAAYLQDRGWTRGQPWGVEVVLPDGFDFALAGDHLRKPAGFWNGLGVRDSSGAALAAHGPVSILLPAGHRGAAFAVYGNFHVLKRYNPADAYAIGVGHLADRLAGGPAILADWPRDDPALSFDERQELQRLLLAAGFDPKGADGIVGPNTVRAVRAYQASAGLVPDGYASADLLERLR